mmetsp:Transcript_49630/g.142313  ORF Transcript_49630/g.142313 Transcript_49630/m.142313 type:complete len:248 (+) Transcript_49630:70-813(+)
MALTVIVKNTFLDLDDRDQLLQAAVRQRSSSVPRAWKLRSNSWGSLPGSCRSGSSIASSLASTSAPASDAGADLGELDAADVPVGAAAAGGGSFVDSPGTLGKIVLKVVEQYGQEEEAVAGVQKGLYMKWEGHLTSLVLPPASRTFAAAPDYDSAAAATKWNVAAVEFKMPTVAAEGGPSIGEACDPFMAKQVAPSNATLLPRGPFAPPPLVQGGGKLNPKARSFEPGLPAWTEPDVKEQAPGWCAY